MVSDIKSDKEKGITVEEEARREIEKESREKAKIAFKAKYRELDAAKKVVTSIELQLEDLRRQCSEGTL